LRLFIGVTVKGYVDAMSCEKYMMIYVWVAIYNVWDVFITSLHITWFGIWKL